MVRLVNVSISLDISKFDRLINRPQFQVTTFLLLNIENSNIAIHTIFVADKKKSLGMELNYNSRLLD